MAGAPSRLTARTEAFIQIYLVLDIIRLHMACTHKIHHGSGSSHQCSCALTSASCQQSLDEVDFERGLSGAAQRNDLSRLEQLLVAGRADPESPAVRGDDGIPVGHSPLIIAALAGHADACKILIKVK